MTLVSRPLVWLPPLALMGLIFYLSAQPDLVPQVVDWLRAEFGHPGSARREQQIAEMLAQPEQSEETFVLFDDNVPVGTASLVNSDLPSRPDLTPWLASVLVLLFASALATDMMGIHALFGSFFPSVSLPLFPGSCSRPRP